MAALKAFQQQFVDLRGAVIGIHRVKLLSASDTLTVPKLANSTNSASSAQIQDANEVAATVTDDGSFTVTIVGAAGDECTVVTHHGANFVNSGKEA